MKNKKISAEISFKNKLDMKFYFKLDDYHGYIYENKTKKLKIIIDGKLCIFREIKFDTIKEKFIE